MIRATALAPANIAFTKFWGWRDPSLVLPFHDTLSMTLSECWTRTTVCPARGDADEIVLLEADEGGGSPGAGAGSSAPGRERPLPPEFRTRVVAQLDRLGELAGGRPRLRVVTMNSMPMGTGVASSASGFAALTLAASAALGLDMDERALSISARISGSGSASRSIPGGYVRWRAGTAVDGRDSYSQSVYPPDHWMLSDILAVVETAPKAVSSREGHGLAPTSPLFEARLAAMPARNARVLAALRDRNLGALGLVLEEEALSLHAIAESSARPVRYRNAATDAVLARVRALRAGGAGSWFTLDAGPNVHVITAADDAPAIRSALEAVPGVRYTITSVPAPGARLDERHLF